MIRAKRQANQVRRNQPNKADCPTDRNGGASQYRGANNQNPLHALHWHAEVLGFAFAEQQSVQRSPQGQHYQQCRNDAHGGCADLWPARAPQTAKRPKDPFAQLRVARLGK